MRLLVKLRCSEISPYETQYHHQLQSFIYNLLRDSKYHNLHDKKGYKFFCYSNVFPVNDLQEGDYRTLIISSPDDGFIQYLSKAVNSEIREIKIGRMRFRVESRHQMNVRIPEGLPFTLITGTPIVIRIPRERYKTYGIEPPKNYDYLFWRTEHPIEAFTSQIENNLLKKYHEYHRYCRGVDVKSGEYPPPQPISIIQRLKFKKQISTKILMKNTEQIIIGTLWEFIFDGLQDTKMMQFALDAGFGERNSLGFGFMNLQGNK